jgi:hypothetical protein
VGLPSATNESVGRYMWHGACPSHSPPQRIGSLLRPADLTSVSTSILRNLEWRPRRPTDPDVGAVRIRSALIRVDSLLPQDQGEEVSRDRERPEERHVSGTSAHAHTISTLAPDPENMPLYSGLRLDHSRNGQDHKQVPKHPVREYTPKMSKRPDETSYCHRLGMLPRRHRMFSTGNRSVGRVGLPLRFLEVQGLKVFETQRGRLAVVELCDRVEHVESMRVVAFGKEEFGRFAECEDDKAEEEDEEGDTPEDNHHVTPIRHQHEDGMVREAAWKPETQVTHQPMLDDFVQHGVSLVEHAGRSVAHE